MEASRRVPALVMRVDEGEQIRAAGIDHVFKLTGATTGGRLGLEEFVVPPGTVGARPHIHHAHDEYFAVLEGQLTVATEDGDVVIGPGDLAAAPRGALHGFRNADTEVPAKALCIYTPAGYEQYFRDVHAALEAGTELSDDLLRDLRRRYQTETL